MSVATPLLTLLKSNFRTWVSAKGFWLVVAGALLPLMLTGAWVGAHRADMEISEFHIEGLPLEEGKEARFLATVTNVGPIAVGPFNATISIHEAGAQFANAINITTIDHLEPGEKRQIELKWNATGGVVFAIAQADASSLLADTDQVGERDEFNNYKIEPLAVSYKDPTGSPAAPATVVGDPASTNEVDLVIDELTQTPENAKPGDNVTLGVKVRNNGIAVENAGVTVRAANTFGSRAVQITKNETMSFAAGETKTLEVTWTVREGAFWQEAFVVPPPDTKDVSSADNHKTRPLVIDPVITDDMRPPEPEERLTIKQFYRQVLTGLHLTLLVPLIALFYATGVIADEKERGSLAYVITRPIPRWLIPITKFVASFLVAAVAIIIGVVITYAFLFGTTTQGQDVGYLTTPLLATLLALFVYGALFTLIGTWIDRPYLVGLGYILAGLILPLWTVPFVRNAGIPFHLNNALSEWRLDEGLQWLPATPEAARAVWVILAIGVGCLVLAGYQMRRREFQVG